MHDNTVCEMVKARLQIDKTKGSVFSPRTHTKVQLEKRDTLMLISASFDGSFSICDLTSVITEHQQPVFKTKSLAHTREILSVVFNPIDQTVITGGNDGAIRFWDTSEKLEMLGEIKAKRKGNDSVGHRHAVTALVLDGNFLFSASDDQTICLWNVSQREKLASISCPEGPILGMKILSDQGRILTWFKGGNIVIWKFNAENESREVLFSYQNKKSEFSSVDYDEELQDVFAGDIDGKVLRIKTEQNELSKEAEQYVEKKLSQSDLKNKRKKDSIVATTENNNGEQTSTLQNQNTQLQTTVGSKYKISMNIFDELFGGVQ